MLPVPLHQPRGLLPLPEVPPSQRQRGTESRLTRSVVCLFVFTLILKQRRESFCHPEVPLAIIPRTKCERKGRAVLAVGHCWLSPRMLSTGIAAPALPLPFLRTRPLGCQPLKSGPLPWGMKAESFLPEAPNQEVPESSACDKSAAF